VSGPPPWKRRPRLALQKFDALFGVKAPQEICCFFSSQKKQVKKAAKLRGAAFFGDGIGLVFQGESGFLALARVVCVKFSKLIM
jgi:hypothetical protein